MRHKSTYFINVPNFADKFFTATVSFLNSKLKSRVKVHAYLIYLLRVVVTIVVANCSQRDSIADQGSRHGVGRGWLGFKYNNKQSGNR